MCFLFKSNAFPQVDEKIDVRSANRPLSYIESATRRSGKCYSISHLCGAWYYAVCIER